jgi:glycogen operon protein
MDAAKIAQGHSHPLGATCLPDGVNFCVYAKHATQVELLLFDKADDAHAKQTILFDPAINRTYDYWHVFVEGVTSGQIYGYRVTGPYDPSRGLRYDPQKLLVDPYAQAVANSAKYSRHAAIAIGDNSSSAMKSVVVDFNDAYNWEGDRPLERPFFDSVIYELHVGGFTRNPNSGVAPAERGTYAGLIAKIPYLVDLGIKTVELMPVQQFDAQAAPQGTNYWGYQPVAWFAPHAAYSSQRDVLAPVNEFRDLVKALHRANIEVILDVVFNHTAEGDERGPTLCFRGFDNPTYYILDPQNPARYLDDTGCRNTINGNESVVRRMILDCLRHWVECYHVDGFRFDLAASLSRGEDGVPLARPPILLDIEADPVLAGTKIIAEAWDAAGLYQLANFGCDRWAVWNGQFRDHVRRFVKSDAGMVGTLADNIVGSANLFQHHKRLPSRSVNYITAHDGFTLNDLVTYNDKHNEANGEQNRDGTDDNLSWNCGVEGPTTDPNVEKLRQQQIKNFLTILFFSEGRPMLLMGDEVRRTQLGNNNAYCQDNPISWLDWDNLIRHGDLYRFMRGLIQFHQQSPIFRDSRFWGTPSASKIIWHGQQLHQPDWSDESRTLAYELFHEETREHLHIILNAYWEPLEFELPATAPDHAWCRLVDTAQNSPQDYCDPPLAVADQRSYPCQARSSVVFVSLPLNPAR